jgi:ribosomal protein S13
MAELRYIVRIAGKDVDGELPIYRALTRIKGIGIRMGRVLAYQFQHQQNIPFDQKIGELPEEMDEKLEQIVLNPLQYSVPNWAVNRKRAINGKDAHLIMNELDFALRTDLQEMKKMHSYKGFRHSRGLRVRGQRTRTGGGKKGKTVGVEKKKNKK